MRPVRFNLNPKEAEIADAISMGKHQMVFLAMDFLQHN
jgi:hypothetical protein